MQSKKIQLFRFSSLLLSLFFSLGINYYVIFSYFGKSEKISTSIAIFCILLTVIIFLLINFSSPFKALPTKPLRSMAKGNDLLKIFLISSAISLLIQVLYAIWIFSYIQNKDYSNFHIWVIHWVIQLIVVILVEAIIFWHGMIRVYLTSIQLGIKIRVIALLVGWIPVLNIYYLIKVISVVNREILVETEKYYLNKERESDKICATKYPILLVHGVFFRDFKHLNYWGRIPAELEKNGAALYYGNQQSALSVPDSAAELSARIKEIIQETGCEKLNVIAHSKGGLDMRYAISNSDIAPYIASVTTINTPHRGCGFAEYLLTKIPDSQQKAVASAYNGALKKFGETPDFLAAVNDLTAEKCTREFDTLILPNDIYHASVGSRLNHATSGKFPLNFSFALVKYFDGPNDGLVSASSFSWGENHTFLTVTGKRGISHADVIDLNRENIPDFDVREFYVQMVSDLKNMGL